MLRGRGRGSRGRIGRGRGRGRGGGRRQLLEAERSRLNLSDANVTTKRGAFPARRGRKPGVLAAAQWVQCDSCGKWRKLPNSSLAMKSLPEVWNCAMNTWDLQYSNCEAEEENCPIIANPNAVQSNEGGKVSTNDDGDVSITAEENGILEDGMKKGRKRGPRKMSDLDPEMNQANFRKAKSFRSQSRDNEEDLSPEPIEQNPDAAMLRKRGLGSGVAITKVDWVMCNTCMKWRKVPPTVQVSSLPDVWVCTMNYWNVAQARCSARQEQDDRAVGRLARDAPTDLQRQSLLRPPTAGVGRGRYERKPKNIAGATTEGGESGAPAKKVTQWVQCERPNCKKWRKVPANIDRATLPDRWFCEMNKWDPERAFCDGPEESDDDADGPASGRAGPSLGYPKGPGSLSYRRFIFGTDGRVRPAYSEKNRIGFGVFSYTDVQRQGQPSSLGDNISAVDEYVEPTRRIGYWWSSAYDEAGQFYRSGSSRRGASSLGVSMAAPHAMDTALNGSSEVFDGENEGPVAAPADRNGGFTTAPPTDAFSQALKVEEDVRSASKSSLLVDCARRLVGWEPAPFPCTKMKSRLAVRRLGLVRRMFCECRVVMCCLAHLSSVQLPPTDTEPCGTADDGPADTAVVMEVESSAERTSLRATNASDADYVKPPAPVPLTTLFSFTQLCRFHDDVLEACRADLSMASLRAAVRRLEQAAEVDVTYNSSGVVSVLPFRPSIQHSSPLKRAAAAAVDTLCPLKTKDGDLNRRKLKLRTQPLYAQTA